MLESQKGISRKVIFGALAIVLASGAVQFASGHDLVGLKLTATAVPVLGADGTVNRAAKADRAAVPPAGGQSQTIVFKVDGLPDTSVLVRVAVRKEEARNRPVAPAPTKPGETRKVACEPVVSVLTEVAKLLQPGRCIT
ncbi:hypothetical protein [Bradyrhizobium lablabi]|uniref:hypothetical protein n=1 Tax=Bradyrhizobium lablabi TaxID=722472 RepID=UPI001BA7EA46|nr:hypothetical protein [Bradyrhizobium lablabi]MBR0691799.1 hypothetical protein [Bradyrhizobium lablabi]